MARHRKDLGARRHVRVDLHKRGFLIPAPDAPWIECTIVDVSEKGACVEVGALVVPDIFGLYRGRRGAPGMLAGLAQRRTGRRPFPECQGAQTRNQAGRR